ncbi:hypothetical protein NX059_008765 [Plenodomus lindquistii]|nr:hypothetical protein NX059_008765 [Plenodomus lindquistii]
MYLLPPTLLLLIHATLASPSPALISSPHAISLVPHHTLFLRQLSDLQTFSGALGGVPASPITNSGDTERPFLVGGDTFDQFENAAQRSCDTQFNGCAEVANGVGGGGGGGGEGGRGGGGRGGNGNGNDNNGGNGNDKDGGNGNGDGNGNGNANNKKRQNNQGGLTVNQCDEQKSKCNAAQQSAPVKDFHSAIPSTNIGPDPNFPEFDLICEA